MKKILLMAVIMTATFFTYAQKKKPAIPTEDLDPDEQRMLDSLMKDPNLRRNMERATQYQQQGAGVGKAGSVSISGFPQLQSELLKKVKDTLTTVQFRAHITAIRKELEDALSPSQKAAIAAIHPGILKTPQLMAQLSVIGWYNGASAESAVLAARAAESAKASVADGNNLSAILIMGGLAEKAIPVLRYMLNRRPDDPLLLNNLAQAYAALGDKATANRYLQHCLRIAPGHPEANATAAQLAILDGKKEEAITYAEKSLSSAFNPMALEVLIRSKPQKKFSEMLGKIDIPGSFNIFKYDLPRQQMLLKEAYEVQEEFNAFRNGIDNLFAELADMADSWEEKGREKAEKQSQNLQRDPMVYMRNANLGHRPLTMVGLRVQQYYQLGRPDNKIDEDLQTKMAELDAKYGIKVKGIASQYAQLKKGLNCGEGRGGDCAKLDQFTKAECKEVEAAAHEYLAGRVNARTDWQTKKRNEAIRLFYLEGTTGFLGAINSDMAKGAWYRAAATYIDKLSKIATLDPIVVSPCNPAAYVQNKPDKNMSVTTTPECPFELEIPMIVGKFSMNCEEASFGISAGASFKFTQNFANRQSTLTVGIGLGWETGVEAGGVEAKIGANIGQHLFVVFDGNNKIADAGMQYSMGLSAGYGVKANIKMPGAGEILSEQGVDMTRGLGSNGTSVGWSFGINSGLNFNEGPLRDLLNGKK